MLTLRCLFRNKTWTKRRKWVKLFRHFSLRLVIVLREYLHPNEFSHYPSLGGAILSNLSVKTQICLSFGLPWLRHFSPWSTYWHPWEWTCRIGGGTLLSLSSNPRIRLNSFIPAKSPLGMVAGAAFSVQCCYNITIGLNVSKGFEQMKYLNLDLQWNKVLAL